MPARLRDIARACRSFGISVEENSGGGSHWKATRDGCGCYTLPAHNGLKEEISDRYIKGLCRHFDLDIEGFKKLL